MRPNASRSSAIAQILRRYANLRALLALALSLGLIVCGALPTVATAQKPLPTPPMTPEQVTRIRATVATCTDRFRETSPEVQCILSNLDSNELYWCLFPPPNEAACFEGELLARVRGALESSSSYNQSYKPPAHKSGSGPRTPPPAPVATTVQPRVESPKPTSALSAAVPGPSPVPEPQSAALALAAETKTIDSLVTGSAAVSAPVAATAGKPFSVYLRVSPDSLQAVLASLAKEVPENATRTGKSGVKLTPRMTATLTGLGFEITPKESVTQAISTNEPTTWQWQVRATEAGLLRLDFALEGALNVEGKEVPRAFYSYEQKVQVQVDKNPIAFLTNNWKWLMSSILIPLVGWAWVVLRGKDKSTGGKKKPAPHS